MGRIVTVTGEVSGSELGFCQSHEHIFLAKGRSCELNPDLRIDDTTKSRDELRLYFAAGGRAIVDAQPVGCGRDASALEEISRESGVRVIASTGFHKLMFYPENHWIHACGSDWLTRLFIGELTSGMHALCDDHEPRETLGCRAGQIKAALDTGPFTDTHRKLFTAAADAANETGCALMAHIDKGSDPVALSDFLLQAGVEPGRVIFCHLDRAVADLGVHKELCARGSTLEYDTIARPKYHDDEHEAAITLDMLAAGWGDRILMALDTTRARLKSYGGGVGLDYILRRFIPLLRQSGVSEAAVESIFVTNPARVFSINT